MNNEKLLQEAKRKFPIGTKFICANTKCEAEITTGLFKINSSGGVNEINSYGLSMRTRGKYHCIMRGGVFGWVKITYKPPMGWVW